jgi:hypothetical protein
MQQIGLHEIDENIQAQAAYGDTCKGYNMAGLYAGRQGDGAEPQLRCGQHVAYVILPCRTHILSSRRTIGWKGGAGFCPHAGRVIVEGWWKAAFPAESYDEGAQDMGY